MTDVEPLAPHLARAQTIAAEHLAAVERPIVVNGAGYVEWPCCEAPAHARAWAVAEARVAAQMWATMVERRVIDATWLDAPTRRFPCPVCFRRSRGAGSNVPAAARGHGHRSSMPCPVCQGGGALATPATCGGVVAMAAAAAAGLVEADWTLRGVFSAALILSACSGKEGLLTNLRTTTSWSTACRGSRWSPSKSRTPTSSMTTRSRRF